MKEDFIIINSLVSICSASSIFASIYMMYKSSIRLSRPSCKIFFNMAIANLLTACGSIGGVTPANGSIACLWQGLATNIFPLSSIFWNLTLLVVFYCSSKGVDIEVYIPYAICWGLPVLISLLPLLQLSYGRNEDEVWCRLHDHDDVNPHLILAWYWMSFYLWIWLCIIAYIYLYYHLIREYIFTLSGPTQMVLGKSVRVVTFYPLAWIICYTFVTISETMRVSDSPRPPLGFHYLSLLLSCLQSVVISVIFAFTFKSTAASSAVNKTGAAAVVPISHSQDHSASSVIPNSASASPSHQHGPGSSSTTPKFQSFSPRSFLPVLESKRPGGVMRRGISTYFREPAVNDEELNKYIDAIEEDEEEHESELHMDVWNDRAQGKLEEKIISALKSF